MLHQAGEKQRMQWKLYKLLRDERHGWTCGKPMHWNAVNGLGLKNAWASPFRCAVELSTQLLT